MLITKFYEFAKSEPTIKSKEESTILFKRAIIQGLIDIKQGDTQNLVLVKKQFNL